VAELVYPPVITLARVVFALQGLRFDLRGTEHVPRTGGAVMAINHVGYLDFTYAGLAADPAGRLVRFMAK
jgi:1-acyl-sn-glycerol-3-phosphate acyltransferase